MPDPSGDGNFDGPMPGIRHATQPYRVARYTHTNQFAFFRDWINWCYSQSQQRNGANVRFDEDEGQGGTTIRFFHGYYLPLGDFLVEGRTPVTEQQLRGQTRPTPQWPEDLDPMFEPRPYTPYPSADTVPGSALYPSDSAERG